MSRREQYLELLGVDVWTLRRPRSQAPQETSDAGAATVLHQHGAALELAAAQEEDGRSPGAWPTTSSGRAGD